MDIAQVIIRGEPQAIQAAHDAIVLALGIVQNKHQLNYEWNYCGFMDDVGGRHDSGCGWAPDGTYCGECTQSSCRDCGIWRNKKHRKALKQKGDG